MDRTLSVEGMTCEHCVKRVKKIIEKHEGVSAVSVSLADKEAVLTCEDGVDVGAIVQAINEFGYMAGEKG